jgi:hypothetical protein
MFPIYKDLQLQQNHIVVASHACLHSSVRSLCPSTPLYYTHTNTARQPALLSPSYRAGAECPLKETLIKWCGSMLALARVLLVAVLTGKASCMHECNNLPSTRKYLTYVLRRVCFLAVAFLAMPSLSASGAPCGLTVPMEQCDPKDAVTNIACSDACHDHGCHGGRCVFVVIDSNEDARRKRKLVRGSHCLP